MIFELAANEWRRGTTLETLRHAGGLAISGIDLNYDYALVRLATFVDGNLVATARDEALPRGQYGMGTYRAAATWQDFVATQP